jgi:transcriptional regulator with XRE-family HTH domain
MAKRRLMKLRAYLELHSVTYADFATRISVSHARTVERYAKEQRVPDATIMKRIAEETAGSVMPNDFFGLGDFEQSMVASTTAVRDAPETGNERKLSAQSAARPFEKPLLAEARL